MKKILILVLVLAVASMASAVLTINITDAQGRSEILPPLNASDYIELLIWYVPESGSISSFDIEIGASPHAAGTLAAPVITAGNRQAVYDYVGPGYTLDWELSASTLAPPLTGGILNPLARVLFHCEGPGDVIISGVDVYTMDNAFQQVIPVINGIIIHQIPEPASMILLAAGGLLLKRKK